MLEGKFIVFEGIDGCGKGTQAKLLEKYLKSQGFKIWLTHEPIENNFWGKIIRFILKRRIHIPQIFFQRMYYWNRLPHVKEIVRHLNNNEVVICDRYWFTTVAHGYLTIKEKAKKIINWHQYLLKPDFIFYLDLSVEEALERIKKNRSNIDFFEKEDKLMIIKEGYVFCWKNIAYLKQIKMISVNAEMSVEEIQRRIQREINYYFNKERK